MAKLSTKSRNAWLKKLENKDFKAFKLDTFKAHFGFRHPRQYKKQEQELTRGGDARVNGFLFVNP
jgi:hypothetical protein|tara:strand:+ start:110 stop:304 length:195 start_codon:yes stop_codon:yes gene_type:complete